MLPVTRKKIKVNMMASCLGSCYGREKRRRKMIGCSEMASPALMEILFQLYRDKEPVEIDHRLYEFGNVEYKIEASASDQDPDNNIYLSISTPLPSSELVSGKQLVDGTVIPAVVQIVEPARQGYSFTLRLNFRNIPRPKDATKIITEIATVQSLIVRSQLKAILRDLINSEDNSLEGISKPTKISYHPRDPSFYITRQPQAITAIMPIRFKESADVVIAISFFQELMDIVNSEEWGKAPRFIWSPIPPPELRGELVEDLTTNGGFLSIELLPRHVKEKRIDKTVWCLLNFYAYVKSHVKCTRGFIQRKMRKRCAYLVKALRGTIQEKDEHADPATLGCGCNIKLKNIPKVRRRCGEFNRKIKRVRYRIKIRGFSTLFRRPLFSIPRFSSTKYVRLE